MALDPQIRTRTRTRRHSACHRHPNEPLTGFCPLCLRDRLAGLESSNAEFEVKNESNVASSSSRRIGGHAGASSSRSVPELRRSKSVAAEKCEGLSGSSLDLRRKSCDVRASSSLSDLFDIDDTKSGGDLFVRVESKNLGLSVLVEPVLETNEEDDDDDDDCDEIRVSDDPFVRNEVDDGEEEDLKTMKEYIEIELQNKKKKSWEPASIFSQKLRKWRQKQKNKKQNGSFNGGTDNNNNNRSKLGQYKDHQSEVPDLGLRRRPCDTEPRFSLDANRISVDDPRFAYDEHRSSWDGYIIARAIPRLTPMLPVVDDMNFPSVNNGVAVDKNNQQMHPILENGPSSSGSAGSTQSNSDMSSSNTGSSSNSMKSSSSSSISKTAGLEGESMKSASKSIENDVITQEAKLVITEKELKDWRLGSESVSNATISTHTTMNDPNRHKRAMTSRWRKVCSLWGYNKYHIPENGSFVGQKDGVERDNSSANLVRNSSVSSGNRTEMHPSGEFVLDRNRSSRHSTGDLDSGLLRLYLSPPFRKSRRSKF